MRAVSVTRTVPAPVSDVRAHLTPSAIVTAECGYEPKGLTTMDGHTVVTGDPAGRFFAPRYVVESDGDSYRYRRVDERSVAVDVETTITLEPRDGRTDIRVRSTVVPRVPVPLLGRLVAWRRRRALARVCNRLGEALR